MLEDLHWAGASTIDLLSVLGERPEPARLLGLGSYRRAEVIAPGGPFDELRRVLALEGDRRRSRSACCRRPASAPISPPASGRRLRPR